MYVKNLHFHEKILGDFLEVALPKVRTRNSRHTCSEWIQFQSERNDKNWVLKKYEIYDKKFHNNSTTMSEVRILDDNTRTHTTKQNPARLIATEFGSSAFHIPLTSLLRIIICMHVSCITLEKFM